MTRSEKPSPRRAVLWTVGVLAVLGCLFALTLLAVQRRHIGYVRYVSPPLRDGTRYTVLYPAGWTLHVGSMSENGFLTPIEVTSRGHDTALIVWLKRCGLVPRGAVQSVWCYGYPLRVHRDSRRDEWRDYAKMVPHDSPFSPIIHYVTLFDVRSNGAFELTDYVTHPTATFRRDDAVITSSFRVLAPGGPTPR